MSRSESIEAFAAVMDLIRDMAEDMPDYFTSDDVHDEMGRRSVVLDDNRRIGYAMMRLWKTDAIRATDLYQTSRRRQANGRKVRVFVGPEHPEGIYYHDLKRS